MITWTNSKRQSKGSWQKYASLLSYSTKAFHAGFGQEQQSTTDTVVLDGSSVPSRLGRIWPGTGYSRAKFQRAWSWITFAAGQTVLIQTTWSRLLIAKMFSAAMAQKWPVCGCEPKPIARKATSTAQTTPMFCLGQPIERAEPVEEIKRKLNALAAQLKRTVPKAIYSRLKAPIATSMVGGLASFAVIFATLGFIPACSAQTIPAAVPMPTPEVTYFGADGKILAGGKLCTYAANTTTPLATYTDSTAGTPNTNPVTLDTAGRASVWIGPQLYKFVLKSGGTAGSCADGVVQWTQDNVSDTTLYFVNYVRSVGTATLITYTAPFSGAIQRTVSSRLSERVSVKDYGATGDGATDDSTAIQNALDQVCTGGAATGLYFPAGRYHFGSLTTCTLAGGLQGLHIYGDGPQSTLESTGTNGILQITGSDGVSLDHVFIENIWFTGISTTAFGLKMIGVAGYGLTNVSSDTIAKGIWFIATQQGYIKGGTHQDVAKGIILDGHISAPVGYWIGSNMADISGVSVQATLACWEISGAADASIHGNHCTGAAVGAHFVAAADTVNVGEIVLDANHYEQTATAAIQIDSGYIGAMITIQNSSFFNAGDELLLAGTVSTRVLNNALNGDVTFTTCFNVCQFIGNKVFAGALTDTTGLIMQYNNHFDASPINHQTFWKDPATFTFPSDSIVPAGDVVTFIGNPLTSGNWGINVPGVGTSSNYAYLKLHDFVLRGSVGGDSLILTSTGGESAKFTPGQTTIDGQILGKARLLSLGAAASPIARIGFNRDTQSGGNYNATGNAFELDAGDVTDSFVINRYDHTGTLVGIDFETDSNRDTTLPRKLEVGATTFTGLSTGLSTAGTVIYCTNCNIANPCTTGGSGAWAFRSGSAWKCPF